MWTLTYDVNLREREALESQCDLGRSVLESSKSINLPTPNANSLSSSPPLLSQLNTTRKGSNEQKSKTDNCKPGGTTKSFSNFRPDGTAK